MNEAMVRIRYELGNDAIIVSNRWIRQKGIKNFFKGKVLEVTAAVDQSPSHGNNPKSQRQCPTQKISKPKGRESDLEQQLQELKNMMHQLMPENLKEEDTKSNPNMEGLINHLEKMELDEKIIRDFSSHCKNLDPAHLNLDMLYQYFGDLLNQNILPEQTSSERIWTFIGPTGVGKTTTIAKVAALETLNNQKQVGLITLDTYRIGAVEQLKTYANILNIPLEVVVHQKDLLQAIEKLQYCDLILIDSAGRSSFNRDQLLEAKTILDNIEEKRNILVVSATTRNTDLKNILENYQSIGYECIILTKLDETQSYGNILNLTQYSDKPLLFITTGQSVPDDIKRVSKDKLLHYVFKGVEV